MSFIIHILTLASLYQKIVLMKPQFPLLPLVNSFLIILLGFLFFTKNNQEGSFAVIDKQKLFNEFKMTKETANQITILNNGLRVQYDSLRQAYSSVKNEDARMQLGQKIEMLQTNIENLNGSYRAEETLKIWKRIQSYTETYSDKENYTFIFGFENNGDIVYFKKGKDITDELLHYINKRYEGIN